MNCLNPIHIKNPYSGKWMYVPCRHCEACLIASANSKAVELKECMSNYKYAYFLTLTYAPEYVPYVLPGFSYVMRGFDYEIIEDLEECIPQDICSPFLQNHPFPAIGVLYYRDVQLFYKRFRKNLVKAYGKERTGFKHFTVCEYGSKFGRPHYHSVILSNDLLYEQVYGAAVKSWRMHDWNRFQQDGTNKALKVADCGSSSYVASYVNSYNCNIGISFIDGFQPRTIRSKSMGFGTSKPIMERFKEDVGRIAREDFDINDRYDAKPFFFYDTTRIDNVSISLISKRYISAAFAKPTGFHEMSFSNFVACATRIINNVNERRSKDISLSAEDVEGIPNLKSQDLAFYRSYKRHKFLLGNRYRFLDYLRLSWKVQKYYASCLLYMQMIGYEECNNKDEYFLELIDTFAEDLNRKRWILYTHTHCFNPKLFNKINLNCPPLSAQKIKTYVNRYRSKLIGKHINDVNQILYN